MEIVPLRGRHLKAVILNFFGPWTIFLNKLSDGLMLIPHEQLVKTVLHVGGLVQFIVQ